VREHRREPVSRSPHAYPAWAVSCACVTRDQDRTNRTTSGRQAHKPRPCDSRGGVAESTTACLLTPPTLSTLSPIDRPPHTSPRTVKEATALVPTPAVWSPGRRGNSQTGRGAHPFFAQARSASHRPPLCTLRTYGTTPRPAATPLPPRCCVSIGDRCGDGTFVGFFDATGRDFRDTVARVRGAPEPEGKELAC
jgi:hypothetical protein